MDFNTCFSHVIKVLSFLSPHRSDSASTEPIFGDNGHVNLTYFVCKQVNIKIAFLQHLHLKVISEE